MSSLTKHNPIEQFIDLLQRGYDAWIEAGKIVAKSLEDDPDFAEKVNAAHPEVSIDTVYAFDRVGRRELYPKLLMSDTPGAKRLRRLPYAAQEKFANNPVSVLIRADKGWDTLKTSVFNLTSDQAAQVFDGDCIRTEAAQRAYLEAKSTKAMVQIDEPYRISGRKLIVLQSCQFTAGQLARILADMES